MTARDEVRREYIVGALREAGAMYEPDARAYLAEHEAVIRAQALREAAAFVDNDDTCDCGGCDTCQPRKLAAGLRAMADATTPTSGHTCGNCDGVDPDSCLMNAKYHPDLKEQQR